AKLYSNLKGSTMVDEEEDGEMPMRSQLTVVMSTPRGGVLQGMMTHGGSVDSDRLDNSSSLPAEWTGNSSTTAFPLTRSGREGFCKTNEGEEQLGGPFSTKGAIPQAQKLFPVSEDGMPMPMPALSSSDDYASEHFLFPCDVKTQELHDDHTAVTDADRQVQNQHQETCGRSDQQGPFGDGVQAKEQRGEEPNEAVAAMD
ncbi:unnamed protein product, partial [Amoebophrya sp. A25]